MPVHFFFFCCRFFPLGIGIAKDDQIGASHVYCCMITIVDDWGRLCAGYGCWDGVVCIVSHRVDGAGGGHGQWQTADSHEDGSN